MALVRKKLVHSPVPEKQQQRILEMWEKANGVWSVKESYSLWKYIARDKITKTDLLVLGTILSVMSSTVLRKEGVTMTFDSMPQQDANLMEKALQVMLLKEDPSTLMNWLNEPNVDVRVIAIIKYILSTGEGL
jgi:hypothetical protein